MHSHGQRAVECTGCGRSFSRKDALAAHRRQGCPGGAGVGGTGAGAGGTVPGVGAGTEGRVQDPLELAVSAAGPPGFDRPLYTLRPLAEGSVIQLQGLELPPENQTQPHQVMQTYQ